jgi:hypothetical protein
MYRIFGCVVAVVGCMGVLRRLNNGSEVTTFNQIRAVLWRTPSRKVRQWPIPVTVRKLAGMASHIPPLCTLHAL